MDIRAAARDRREAGESFPATYAYDAEQLRPSPLNFSPRHAKNVARSRIDGTMDSFDSTLGGALLSMVAAEKAADEREAARKAADALAAEVEFRKAQAKEEAKAARAAARADRRAEALAREIARAAVDTVLAEEDAIVAAEKAAVEQAAAEAAAAEAAVVAAQKAAEEEAAAMKAALIEAEAKAKAKADAEAKAVQRKAELKLKLKRCLWREWTRPQFDVAFDAGEEKTAARLGRFSERDLHIFNKAIDLVPRLMDAYKSAHAQKRAQDAFEAMMEQEDPELRPATRAKPPAGLGLVCRRFIINVPTGGRGIASGRGWSIRTLYIERRWRSRSVRIASGIRAAALACQATGSIGCNSVRGPCAWSVRTWCTASRLFVCCGRRGRISLSRLIRQEIASNAISNPYTTHRSNHRGLSRGHGARAAFVILAALGWASGLSSLTPHTLPAARSVLPRLPPPALCTTSQHQQPADATQSEPPPSTSTGLSIAQARVLLGGVAAVYGTNYAAVKCLDTWVGSPADAATLRFALCVAVLTPIVMTAPKIVRSGPVMRDGLEIGLYFSLGYIVQALALEHSPAGIQAFLLSLTVVVCPALESLIERTKQPPRVWFAAALAAIGVAMLTLEAGSGGMDDFIGGAIGLWQPIFFGLGFYRLEKAMHTHSSDSSSVSENCQVPLEVCASAGKGGTSEEVLFDEEEALVKAGRRAPTQRQSR